MRTAVETVFALLTLADVGSSLDDACPTLVLAVGGGELRFVNAAAAAYLGIASLDAAFGAVPALDPAILRQVHRFADRATAGTSGLELLRIPNGLRTAVLGCRMTHLGAPVGEPVVLLRLEGLAVRGGAHDIAASLALLAAANRLLAAFDAEGEVLAASGDYVLLEGSQDEIEDFVVAAADSALARKTVQRGESLSEALVVRIAGDRELRLIAIEPVERDGAGPEAAAPDSVPVSDPGSSAPPVTLEPDHMLDPIFFALSPLPTPDDYAAWQADARREIAAAPGSPEIDAEVAAFAAELGAAADASATPGTDDGASAPSEDAGEATLTGSPVLAEADDPSGAAAAEAMETEAASIAITIDGGPTDAADIPGAEPAVVPDDGTVPPRFPGASAEDLRLAVELVTTAPVEASEPETVAPASEAAEVAAPAPTCRGAPSEPPSTPVAAAPLPADPATPIEDGFVFAPEPRPRRFVWQMDAQERFTFVSDDFRAAVGPRAADLVGATWSDLRARLGIDRDGIVAAALARRDTWSGLTTLWPVEGEALRIPVDLAALPAFGRRREFEGYRGFGVCRTVEAVPDPSGTGLRILLEDFVPEPPEGDGPAGSRLDDSAPSDQPGDGEAPMVSGQAAAAASSPSVATALASAASAKEPELAESVVSQPLPPDSGAAVPFDAEAAEAAATDAPDETETPPALPSPPAPVEPEAAFAGEIDRPDDVSAAIPSKSGSDPESPARPDVGPARDVPSDVAEPTPAPQASASVRPDAPGSSRVVTVPVNRGSRIVTLPTAHRTVPDRNRLSGPERIAFRQIAAALGARIEGDDGQPTPRATEPSSDEAPADDDRPASVGAIEAGSARETAQANPPVSPTDGPGTGSEVETLPTITAEVGVAVPRDAAQAEATHPDVTVPSVGPDGGHGRLDDPAAEPAAWANPPAPAVPPAPDVPAEHAPLRLAETTVAAAADAVAAAADAVAEGGSEPAKTAAEDEIATVIRILDRLTVGCAVLKDDGLAHVNEAFLTMLGYADRADFEAAGGLDAIFAGEHVGRRFVEEGQVRPLPLISRTGAVVPVAARMAGIPWGAGSAVLLTLDRMPRQAIEPVAETVSGRAALDALGEARERANELEAVVDTATDGVLMLDVDGGVISANRAAEALFGMERADMSGRPLVDLLAPESRRSAQDYLDGLARNGVASVLNDGREVIGQVPPDGLIPLFMTIGRISSGRGSKFCAVLRDITQWKKSEEELTGARRRAEEASSHKSEFLAKISHEIRTPLNAIIGFSEVMLDERFGPIGSDRYKDYLRDIHTSGSHIMSLINDLLDLSKVEAGKMELKFEAVSLADIAGECVALMQPQANRERIIIRTSLPSGVPAVVADGRSVRQIILNLLSNAVKFTPAGGQVIVSTALEDSGEVVVRVRDTGFGMSEKEIQAALEPFRQLHTTRVRSGGTGLGLPLTKALVEANRATFRIDSVVNQGTLVSITFPVTRVLAG